MRGVMANIAHLNNERSRSTVWGDDGWKKVVVCVVVDGRKVFNPRTRAMLAALGVYQEGIAKNMVGDKPVVRYLLLWQRVCWLRVADFWEPCR
jgi:chitin synthase